MKVIKESQLLDWNVVSNDWLGGNQVAYSPDVVLGALQKVRELLPDVLEKFVSGRGRGSIFLLPIIRLGRVLASLENVQGSAKIIDKLRREDYSALPEAEMAAYFALEGLSVEVEPEVAGRHPDLRVHWQQIPIYIEITAAQTAQTIRKAEEIMRTVAESVSSVPGANNRDIQIQLFREVSTDDIELILRSFNSVSDTSKPVILDLPDLGRIGIRRYESHPGSQMLPPFADSPILYCVKFTFGPEANYRIDVSFKVDDERAQELLEREGTHFISGECNVVILDLTRVPAGIKGWQPLIKRRLQPSLNRRFSAVLLYSSATTSRQIEYDSALIRNPHTYAPIPEDFLQLLSSFPGPLA